MNQFNTNRVAVVLACNIHWAPYYYRYDKVLDEIINHLCMINCKYDLIIWNREQIEEKKNAGRNANLIEFSKKDVTNSGNILKIFKFLRFARFVKKALTRVTYDKIIFLGTYACMPALIGAFLRDNYARKYWIDVRDYQYEYNWFYKYLEAKVFKYAKYIAISSPEYETFLPKREYLHIHNIDPDMISIKKKYKKITSKKIRISYIGHVGRYDISVRFINALANDERFIIQYYGTGTEPLRDYCLEHNIQNVKFHGKFKREETILFYNETDIVNNVYGNNNEHLKTALSNKLYYSLFFELPIIVCENTAMAKVGKECGNSFIFSDNYTSHNGKSFANDLYDWYIDFLNVDNRKSFKDVREKFQKEDNNTIETLKYFLLSKV